MRFGSALTMFHDSRGGEHKHKHAVGVEELRKVFSAEPYL